MGISDSVFSRIIWPCAARCKRGIAALLHRREVADRRLGIYAWDFGGERVFSSMKQVGGLMEEYLRGRFDGFYGTGFGGKAVLDVGGFVGDSALHFLKNGASKVDVYEPLDENVAAARLNLERFGARASVRKSFICGSDGRSDVRTSGSGTTSFGEDSRGDEVCSMECMSVERALAGGYDVAKFDCEGCEFYLANADMEAIRRIPHWIIEFHRNKDRNGAYGAVLERFHGCGFIIERKIQVWDNVEIIHFRKHAGNGGEKE